MLISSIAIGNALGATYHYQQEALYKSIGACTNNCAVSMYASNNEDIANKALLQGIFYVKQ